MEEQEAQEATKAGQGALAALQRAAAAWRAAAEPEAKAVAAARVREDKLAAQVA